MSAPETPPETTQAERSASVFPVEKIRTALVAYRIMAWVTGIWLIALCGEVISHLVYHHEIRWIEVVHGWVYFAYMLAAFNLAIKVRWPIGKTIGVLLAGTVPILGIIVEHRQTKNVKAQFAI
jgi:integral membrane protein